MPRKSIEVVANEIKSKLHDTPGISIEIIDVISDKECYVAYYYKDSYQSSFILKYEYGSQFSEPGYKATSGTFMLPEIPESANEDVILERIKQLDEEAFKNTNVPPSSSIDIGIQSVPDSTGRAPKIGRKTADLNSYLEFISFIAKEFDSEYHYKK